MKELKEQVGLRELKDLKKNKEYSGYIVKIVNELLAIVRLNQFTEGLVHLVMQCNVYQVITFTLHNIDTTRNIFIA